MKTLLIVASIFAHDGDSLKNGKEMIRLWGIDAPELSQTCDEGTTKCGKEARDRLQALIKQGPVVCVELDRDRWKRPISKCTVNDIDLSEQMVLEGFALAYRKYSTDYIEEEDLARKEKKGLWSGTFIEPWLWRKGERW